MVGERLGGGSVDVNDEELARVEVGWRFRSNVTLGYHMWPCCMQIYILVIRNWVTSASRVDGLRAVRVWKENWGHIRSCIGP